MTTVAEHQSFHREHLANFGKYFVFPACLGLLMFASLVLIMFGRS